MRAASALYTLGSKKGLLAVVGASAGVATVWGVSPADDATDSNTSQANVVDLSPLCFIPQLLRSLHSAWLSTPSDERDRESLTAATLADFANHGGHKSVSKSSLFEQLLERVADGKGSHHEVQDLEQILTHLLTDESSTKSLLRKPHAISALITFASSRYTISPDIATMLAKALIPSAMPRQASFSDIQYALHTIEYTKSPNIAKYLALCTLNAWSKSSVLNCTAIADADGGGTIVNVAASAGSSSLIQIDIRFQLTELMKTLAQQCPANSKLRMDDWLYHLICFAADASASKDWKLATSSLEALATCLLGGAAALPGDMLQVMVLPLLRALGAMNTAMRGSIAKVVLALAEGRKVQLPDDDREIWSEVLLSWMVAGDDQSSGIVAKECVAALTALSSPAGPTGLHIAHSWLAEMIIHLSRQVRPYNDVVAEQNKNNHSSSGGEGDDIDDGSKSWRYGRAWLSSLKLPSIYGYGGGSREEGEREGTSSLSSSYWWWRGPSWPGGATSDKGTAALISEQQQLDDVGDVHLPPPPSQQQQQPQVVSDSELNSWINAAPVGPVYARAVAADLIEASGRVSSPTSHRDMLPSDAETMLSPAALAKFPAVAAAVDVEVADQAVCQGLKVLCALAVGHVHRRSWLIEAGILPLIHRLTLDHAADVSELNLSDFFEDALPLCVRRQTARLLALLSADQNGAVAIQEGGWVPWLQHLAVTSDCKLSSSAARTLLHIESARAVERIGGLGLVSITSSDGDRRGRHSTNMSTTKPLLPCRQEEEQDNGSNGSSDDDDDNDNGDNNSRNNSMVEAAHAALANVRRDIERRLDALRPALTPDTRLVLLDGIHLFDPLSPHHETLAREGIDATGIGAPSVDVVFVHGIRGGAFVTWRREGVFERGKARGALDRTVCWPSAWVAEELPDARLLSAEYSAPITGWEGESLPLQHTAAQLREKLVAAGVGKRPVIFVSHSMGGLIVKEMLTTNKELRDACCGVAFYSVPHFGSKFADWGWNLRYLGASPASAVAHLKYGPHLEKLNNTLKAMSKSGDLKVLSFGEGQPTRVSYLSAHIVPHESAFPGYGEFVVLPDHDHINVCKPYNKSDPAYSHLISFLKKCSGGAGGSSILQ
jgi:pimeloyl-ACP methyl ester carboxylesterase